MQSHLNRKAQMALHLSWLTAEKDILQNQTRFILLKTWFLLSVKPGFHMIVTVGDESPRQARGHIGDVCVKWKHFLKDVADRRSDGDGTGTYRKS